MHKMYVADVGAGLCSGILTLEKNASGYLQLDCGDQKNGERAFCGLQRIMNGFGSSPDTFVLSHFHLDHYSGLYHAVDALKHSKNLLDISRFYYPIVPMTSDVDMTKFLRVELFVNALMAVKKTSILEFDLNELVRKISKHGSRMHSEALREGSRFKEGDLNFEVLWPPEKLCSIKISKRVQKVLINFEDFLERYPKISELYNRCIRNINVDNFTQAGEHKINYQNYEKSSEYDVAALERILVQMNKIERELFENEIKKINGEIKKVSNHLSLAFFETNKKILFLGDLEQNEISMICDTLKSKGIRNFEILITPHHGTHWHDKLKNLKFEYSVSSIGGNLTRYFKQEFLCVSHYCLLTFCFGDLMVP
jgi:beta-lactamase superfamily II metal-dependent hydrolase